MRSANFRSIRIEASRGRGPLDEGARLGEELSFVEGCVAGIEFLDDHGVRDSVEEGREERHA